MRTQSCLVGDKMPLTARFRTFTIPINLKQTSPLFCTQIFHSAVSYCTRTPHNQSIKMEITVNVKDLNGVTTAISVGVGAGEGEDTTATVTVESLKESIQEELSIPSGSLSLFFGGNELEENNALSHYGVRSGSTITFIPIVERTNNSVQAIYCIPEDTTETIPLGVNDTVNVSFGSSSSGGSEDSDYDHDYGDLSSEESAFDFEG